MNVLLAMLLVGASLPISVEGNYTGNMTETASGLRLLPGGRYQWYFSQGALDLLSQGTWRRQGDTLLLTSDPVMPPRFVYTGTSRAAQTEGFAIHVVAPNGRPVPNVDLLVHYAGSEDESGSTDSDGSREFAVGKDAPEFIALGLPMFEFRSEEFRLRPVRGDIVNFRLEPNDLGKESFRDLPLKIGPEAIEMEWRGPPLRYRPAN